MTDNTPELSPPGAHATPLDPDEDELWEGYIAHLRAIARGERVGWRPARIDYERALNALHVPKNAGSSASDLERILRRIPDGWGRWVRCDRGWYPLIIELDHRLAEIDPAYHVHQIKEKFGALRFYFQGAQLRRIACSGWSTMRRTDPGSSARFAGPRGLSYSARANPK